MKGRLSCLFSSDVPDLTSFSPEKPDNFGFSLTIFAGADDDDDDESFDTLLCTPKWIEENKKSDEVIFGRHYIIVFEYNYEKLERRIRDYVESCVGESWRDVAVKIGRLGFWEFEDYKEWGFTESGG